MLGQLRCTDCSQGTQNPGSTIFRKKSPFFLNFIGPVKHPWVLYHSEIMQMGFTELLRARVVFAKSIKVLAWQPGAPKFREHDFPKKKPVFFLNFIGPVTPPWVLYHSEIMQLGFTKLLRAIAVFAKSIKVLAWQPGAPKFREHNFPKKNLLIL